MIQIHHLNKYYHLQIQKEVDSVSHILLDILLWDREGAEQEKNLGDTYFVRRQHCLDMVLEMVVCFEMHQTVSAASQQREPPDSLNSVHSYRLQTEFEKARFELEPNQVLLLGFLG